MTEVLLVDPLDPDPTVMARAAECLRAGGLVAFPTETVYGLGACAYDRGALGRLFAAKERPAHDPLIVHVSSGDEMAPLVADMSEAVRSLGRRFWPGPLTLVVRRSSNVPDEVTAGLDTVAIRVPSHPVALALLRSADVPVAAPSANLFSRPSPTTAAHVLADLEGRIDIVIDGGPTYVGVESTVLDVSRNPPVILRPGAVSLEMLRTALPDVRVDAPVQLEGSAMPSPGLATKHYAPRSPFTLYDEGRDEALRHLMRDARALLTAGRTVAVLAFAEDLEALEALPVRLIELGREREPAEVAQRLYAALRECDEVGPDVILARTLSTTHRLTMAIRDRQRRAAAGRVIGEGAGTDEQGSTRPRIAREEQD